MPNSHSRTSNLRPNQRLRDHRLLARLSKRAFEIPILRLFLVYSEGNFIESSPEMPYFQTGESKFGKPILDRVITPETSLSEACKCVLVSFDSTMRSNLSVGAPLDLLLYRRDSFTANLRQRLVEDDPFLQTIRREWNETLRRGVRELPGPDWLRDAEG